ncbi:MAG: type III secretion system export apparatus subunit SctU [Bryobacteraceae bacterium]|nr:type III secretion system export apparatus subunit SctU [Bryobacteraceae bacterium]
MAGEKTEQPTEKKLRDARKKGQIARSADLTQALLFLGVTATLQLSGWLLMDKLRWAMQASFDPRFLSGDLEPAAWSAVTAAWWREVAVGLAPLLGAAVLIALAGGFLQARGLFSLEVLKPQLSKLNPIEGFKNLFFKAKTWIELGKNLLKLAIIAGIAWFEVKRAMAEFAFAGRLDVPAMAGLAAGAMYGLLYKTGGAFLVIGFADYMIQKKLHLKEMMMTKEEVKREYKESEGDPHVKHMRKELHHQLLNEAEAGNAAHADVVVVNPVHLAVALQYRADTMNAPRVVAKGQNLKAAKIRDIARKSNVPVMQDIPLARQLFKVETGHEIPEEMYTAVAEVLLWVRELKEKGK